MITLFFLLFIKINFGFSFKGIGYTTTIYKDSKLYVYEPDDVDLKWSGLTIYNLKDGPVSEIQNQVVNFTNSNPVYAPQFLQLPQGLPNKRSQETWMVGGIVDNKLKDNDLIKENWSCEIINDSELKFYDDFIPMLPFKNVSKSGFSQTIVNSKNGPELYLIGGLAYIKELDKELITNYFYKYEFNTGKWVDLNKYTKSTLQPRAFHKVIEVDNSLLLIGGIQNDEAIKENFEHTAPINDGTDFSGLTTVFKFDLKEQKWSTVKTKLNKDSNIYKSGQGVGSVYNIHNGKIISYISLYNYATNDYEPQIGVLNYNTWEWEWHNVKTEAGMDNNLFLSYYQTLIINDQLILIHGMSNQKQVKKLYVINLNTYTFQGLLNISGEDSKSQVSELPGWAVAVTVIGSVFLIILLMAATWFCLRFKRQVNVDDTKSEQAMQEVWVSTNHESDGLKSKAAPFPKSNTKSAGGFKDSILNDDSIVNYECFQHEVELEDLEIVKPKTFGY